MICTINQINPVQTPTGIGFQVQVNFTDPTTGFTINKTYSFSITETVAAAQTQITADANTFKTALGSISTLQQYVGTVLTI
jgi:hypothetical protein